MIAPAIIPTKLIIPDFVAGCLNRQRLQQWWSVHSGRRLVLITAGAGYGKTTFLTQIAADDERPVLWFSLDEHDQDLSVFSAHLLHGLGAGEMPDPTVEGFANQVLATTLRCLAEDGCGTKNPAPSRSTHSKGYLLIFDDVQLVSTSGPVLEFISRLLRYLPSQCTLVLASREPIKIATGKLNSAGMLAKMSVKDLAFSAGETTVLLTERFGVPGQATELGKRLTAATEGWAAGIQMVLQSTGSDPESLATALGSMKNIGSGWFSYFAEEVVGGLDPDLARFLRHTSVLPRLSGKICDQLLQTRGGQQKLQELAARQLFITALSGSDSGFRYHHLFRDFLREDLQRHESEATVVKLGNRAAELLIQQGDLSEALSVAAETGNIPGIGQLVTQHGPQLLASGRYEIIRQALETVPSRELARQPVSLAVLGEVQLAQGDLAAAEKCFRQASTKATSGRQKIFLMSRIAQVHLSLGKNRSCLNLCRKALAEKGRPDQGTKGRLLSLMGVAQCELGRPDEGEKHLRAWHSEFRNRSEEEQARSFYLLQANVHFRRGEFADGERAARRALRVFRNAGNTPQICHCLGVLAHVCVEAGRERQARQLALEALRPAESLAYRVIEGFCHLVLGRCALLAGEVVRAEAELKKAAAMGEQLGETSLHILPLLALGELQLKLGRRGRARQLFTDALELSVDLRSVYQEAQSCLLLGLLLFKKDAPQTRILWHRAEGIIKKSQMSVDRHRLLLFRLFVGEVSQKHKPAALTDLVTGIVDAGHEFLLLKIDPLLAEPVLLEAQKLGVAANDVNRLLSDLGVKSGSKLKATEVPVAQTARLESKAQSLQIQALGPLVVNTGIRELELADWKSNRALRLFQYLVVKRFCWVPRDELLEALWPECNPRKGANNLRQTIHVLRRLLEPNLEDLRQSSYVKYHQEACCLDPGQKYSYDVENLEKLLTRVEVAWSSEKVKQAELLLDKAIENYRGDFMAESPYDEIVCAQRDTLADRLQRNLEKLLHRYENQERWNDLIPICRNVLTRSPWHEEFHRLLIQGLAKLGHRREALEAYHRYEMMMVQDLDLLPSPRLKNLAEAVTSW